MNYLALSDMIRAMPRYYYVIFYALWAFDLLNIFPPSEIYTLKGQLYFLGISTIFSFVIGFIFGARLEFDRYKSPI